jgi:hypothetical protein
MVMAVLMVPTIAGANTAGSDTIICPCCGQNSFHTQGQDGIIFFFGCEKCCFHGLESHPEDDPHDERDAYVPEFGAWFYDVGRCKWDDGKIVKEPTATEPGKKVFHCLSEMGSSEWHIVREEEIPALGVPEVVEEKGDLKS